MKLRLFITLLLFLVLPLNSLYAYKSVSSSYDNVLGGTTIYYSDGTSSDYMPNAFGGYNIYDGGYLNSSNYGTGSDTGITYNFFENNFWLKQLLWIFYPEVEHVS